MRPLGSMGAPFRSQAILGGGFPVEWQWKRAVLPRGRARVAGGTEMEGGTATRRKARAPSQAYQPPSQPRTGDTTRRPPSTEALQPRGMRHGAHGGRRKEGRYRAQSMLPSTRVHAGVPAAERHSHSSRPPSATLTFRGAHARRSSATSLLVLLCFHSLEGIVLDFDLARSRQQIGSLPILPHSIPVSLPLARSPGCIWRAIAHKSSCGHPRLPRLRTSHMTNGSRRSGLDKCAPNLRPPPVIGVKSSPLACFGLQAGFLLLQPTFQLASRLATTALPPKVRPAAMAMGEAERMSLGAQQVFAALPPSILEHYLCDYMFSTLPLPPLIHPSPLPKRNLRWLFKAPPPPGLF